LENWGKANSSDNINLTTIFLIDKIEYINFKIMSEASSHPNSKFLIFEYNTDPRITEFLSNWNIESPKDGESLDDGLTYFSGWALTHDPGEQSNVHLVLRLWNRTLSCQLHVHRQDVLQHFYGNNTNIDYSIPCGFYIPIPLEDISQGFEYGFEVCGLIRIVAKVTLENNNI